MKLEEIIVQLRELQAQQWGGSVLIEFSEDG